MCRHLLEKSLDKKVQTMPINCKAFCRSPRCAIKLKILHANRKYYHLRLFRLLIRTYSFLLNLKRCVNFLDNLNGTIKLLGADVDSSFFEVRSLTGTLVGKKSFITFWDNRCTMQYACNDYQRHPRAMSGITIAGSNR